MKTEGQKRAGKILAYTTHELAAELGITSSTIIAWDRKGLIRVIKTLGGHRRIPVSEVARIKVIMGFGEELK
jgi:excisionase family DNA binding protein